MSSNLTPRRAQAATLAPISLSKSLNPSFRGWQVGGGGGRLMTSWVAGCLRQIRRSHAEFALSGGRCGSFIQNSTSKKKREGKERGYTYSDLNRDNLPHLQPHQRVSEKRVATDREGEASDNTPRTVPAPQGHPPYRGWCEPRKAVSFLEPFSVQ